MLTLLGRLFGSNRTAEWNMIKSSDELYPAGPIAILQIKSKKSGFLTGWINKGYKDYPYKTFCKQNFLIKVNFQDSRTTSETNPDMATVEEYFCDNLRKLCVSHLVARLTTDDGLNLEMYLENKDAGMIALLNLSNDPNRLVSFSYENNYDPDWDAVQGLFQLIDT